MSRRRSKPRRPPWVLIATVVMTLALIGVVIGISAGWNDCGSARLAMGDAAYAARCAKLPNWDGGVMVAAVVVVGVLWLTMKGGWS